MNKKILIIMVVGILLLGIGASALAFGIDPKDFTEKVNKIYSKKLCDKLPEDKKDKFKKCKNKDYEVDVDNSNIEITQNENGVYKINSK